MFVDTDKGETTVKLKSGELRLTVEGNQLRIIAREGVLMVEPHMSNVIYVGVQQFKP